MQQQLAQEKEKNKHLSGRIEELEKALSRKEALSAPQKLRALDSE